ncbi:MAG: universal stress protein [Acidobacteriota bacterium]|nr:universal stress protein [Blastocatellia bacterium]MDW8413073.1 universal stress protein [Acidobacteriota bacterium]
MRILIATDGSKYSEAALEAVLKRPWPQESLFRVVSVAEIPALSYVTGEESVLDYDFSTLKSYHQKIIDEAVAKIRAVGKQVSGILRDGVAAEEIVDEAKQWSADLILVGTHGRRGLSRFLLGSVAQQVAAHAHCSVEIVRMQDKEVL